MAGNSQPKSDTHFQSASTPRPFTPTVIEAPKDFKLNDAHFTDLEELGGVNLTDEHRTKLETLADFWLGDLSIRLSPRPKQFRRCLDNMEKAFLQAERVCDWDHQPEYHLVHWAMETPVKDANGFPVALAALQLNLKTIRETVTALRECLPADPGRQRPFDDEQRIIFLANIFEEAGGKAVAYAGGYYEEGSMANTPFRKFSRHFYSLLPAEDKRDLGGFDDALRDALATRRARSAKAL